MAIILPVPRVLFIQRSCLFIHSFILPTVPKSFYKLIVYNKNASTYVILI